MHVTPAYRQSAAQDLYTCRLIFKTVQATLVIHTMKYDKSGVEIISNVWHHFVGNVESWEDE